MRRAIPELPATIWPSMYALASGEVWPPRTPAQMDRFAATLRRHRLLPIAANDTALESAVLDHVRSAWELDRDAEAAQAAAYDRELEELIPLLDRDDYVPIKGVDYRLTLYPDRTLRPMNDLDFLIRTTRLESNRNLLLTRGYAPSGREGLAQGYYARSPGAPLVELITRLTQEQRHEVDYEEIFRERVDGPLGMPALADHHALATQALTVGTMLFEAHARKYLDLWLLSRDRDVAERAMETAVRWKMRHAFYAAMWLLNRIFPASGREWALRRSARILAPSELRLLERFVLPSDPATRTLWRPLVLAKRLALLDSNPIRWRFVSSYVRERLVVQ